MMSMKNYYNLPGADGKMSSQQDFFDIAIETIDFPEHLDDDSSMDLDLQLASFKHDFDHDDNQQHEGQEQEQFPVEANGNIFPQKFDIICGRDKNACSHVGNKRFRVIVEMNRERYQTARSRDEKTKITVELISTIRSCEPGGRFLKMDDNNYWVDVGDAYAREKVSHALRSAKNPHRQKSRKVHKLSRTSLTKQADDAFGDLLEKQQDIFLHLVNGDGSSHQKECRTSYTLEKCYDDSDSKHSWLSAAHDNP